MKNAYAVLILAAGFATACVLATHVSSGTLFAMVAIAIIIAATIKKHKAIFLGFAYAVAAILILTGTGLFTGQFIGIIATIVSIASGAYILLKKAKQ